MGIANWMTRNAGTWINDSQNPGMGLLVVMGSNPVLGGGDGGVFGQLSSLLGLLWGRGVGGWVNLGDVR